MLVAAVKFSNQFLWVLRKSREANGALGILSVLVLVKCTRLARNEVLHAGNLVHVLHVVHAARESEVANKKVEYHENRYAASQMNKSDQDHYTKP